MSKDTPPEGLSKLTARRCIAMIERLIVDIHEEGFENAPDGNHARHCFQGIANIAQAASDARDDAPWATARRADIPGMKQHFPPAELDARLLRTDGERVDAIPEGDQC